MENDIKIKSIGRVIKDIMYAGFDIPEPKIKYALNGTEEKVLFQEQRVRGKKTYDFTIQVGKAANSDGYYYNGFRATKSETGVPDVSAVFAKDRKVTSNEAINLLEGRSVEKTYNHKDQIEGTKRFTYRAGDTYKNWLKLDTNDVNAAGNCKIHSFGEEYKLNLETKLSEYPIKGLDQQDTASDLIKSLKKGNLEKVVFEKDGNTESRYIAADPKNWDIKVYDTKMKLIVDTSLAKNLTPQNRNGQSQSEGQAAERQHDNKQGKEQNNKAAENANRKPGSKKKSGQHH